MVTPSISPCTLDTLDPREFENLVFDLLQAVGMIRATWRTPGSDGGRDIEGIFHFRDASGHMTEQKWYVECKRYSTSVDWPTIFEKVSYAEVDQADFLLLATNSNPSPTCETRIETWNQSRRLLKIRTWRGYELDRIISQYPAIALKYNLAVSHNVSLSGFLSLVTELMKFVQAAYAAHEMKSESLSGLEAAAALSELLSLRMKDLETYGRVCFTKTSFPAKGYNWLSVSNGSIALEVEETSLRAVAAVFKHITGATGVALSQSNNGLTFCALKPKFALEEVGVKAIIEVALWTQFQISAGDDKSSLICTVREVTR